MQVVSPWTGLPTTAYSTVTAEPASLCEEGPPEVAAPHTLAADGTVVAATRGATDTLTVTTDGYLLDLQGRAVSPARRVELYKTRCAEPSTTPPMVEPPPTTHRPQVQLPGRGGGGGWGGGGGGLEVPAPPEVPPPGAPVPPSTLFLHLHRPRILLDSL